MSPENLESTAKAIQLSSLLEHMRNPQNLLTYLVFSAWCKFMGVSSYLPTVTIGSWRWDIESGIPISVSCVESGSTTKKIIRYANRVILNLRNWRSMEFQIQSFIGLNRVVKRNDNLSKVWQSRTNSKQKTASMP